MLIGGYQKVSLMDYPGVVASIVFLRGCNFMCPYCHNPELISAEGDSILEEEFFSILLENRKMLSGVVVTGGEPCLQADLPEFLSKIKNYGFKVKLDTNGSKPEMLKLVLLNNIVDYVAMDIKASWKNYPLVTSFPNIAEEVKKSLSLLQSSNIDHEFRTTIFPGVHSISDFESIARELYDGTKYFIQDIRLAKTLFEISAPLDLFAENIANELKLKFPRLIIGHR